MFGVVPKTLWQRSQNVDESNRILLATRTLLAVHESAGRILLVDTGTGPKWGPDQAGRFAIELLPGAIDCALRGIGAGPSDVTDVVVTHLHFDHGGGMTDWTDDSHVDTTLRYPKAVHWIHGRHLHHARHPTERDRASFVPSDFEPLEAAGVLRVVEGDAPASPIAGLTWRISNGHTPGQLLPEFDAGDGRRLLFIGDIVPTAAHLPLAWIMGYDLYPLTTLEERKSVYQRCRDEALLLAFPHDPQRGIVSLGFDGGKPCIAASWQ